MPLRWPSSASSCWKAQKISGSTGSILEAHFIGHVSAALHAVVVLALEPIGKQAAALRHGVMRGGGGLRERKPRVRARDQVTAR